MSLKTCRMCSTDLAGKPCVDLGTAYKMKGSRYLCVDELPTNTNISEWIIEYCRSQVDPLVMARMQLEEARATMARQAKLIEDLKNQVPGTKYK